MAEIVAQITDSFDLEYKIPRLKLVRLQEIGAGKLVRVEFKAWRKPRTKRQNAYLWSTVYPAIIAYIKSATGQEFSAEDLHLKYKKQYLGYVTCDIPGMEDLTRLKSSTELDCEEFWDQLVEHICREWAELGLFIPLPKKRRGDVKNHR